MKVRLLGAGGGEREKMNVLDGAEKALRAGIAACGSALSWAWMQFTPAIETLIVMMVLDFLTGILAAKSNGEKIESGIASRGAAKRLTALLGVLAAEYLARMMPDITGGAITQYFSLGTAAAGWFIVSEFISIWENVRRAGWTRPKVIDQVIETMKDQQRK